MEGKDFDRHFSQEVHEWEKKSRRSLRKLCRLIKEKASDGTLRRAYESFSRVFGSLKAYMLVYLVGVNHSDEAVIHIREGMRHEIGRYIQICRFFEYLYPGQDYTHQKPYKIMIRTYNRVQQKTWLELVDRGPKGLNDAEPCD
jgi:hypothetical protein